MHAIIIGSGIAGLSTALALNRVGIGVTLYERAPRLTEVGAGISLWANALRALDAFGAGEAVRAVSLPMTHSEMRVQSGHTIAVRFQATTFEERFRVKPFVAMVHRADLVGALANGLPAGVAHYGHECVSVDPNGPRPRVQFQNGHSDEAHLIIGADGIRSAVRTALFGPAEPRYAGYTCWRGIGPRPASLASGYVGEWWGRGQRFGITTLTGDRVYWWATQNQPAGQRADQEQAHVAAAFRDWADPVPEIIATTRPADVIRNDILDRPPQRRWSVGRAVLIGDAAHPTTPNFGQGGCLAIEDAVVLARHLHDNAAPERAITAFAAERYPRTTAVTQESWQFGAIGQWQGRLACGVRDRLFRLLLPLTALRSLPKYASFDVGSLMPAQMVPTQGANR
jgi:2-polyprenyl-6-methoxyphenol hydroxylase-like FAD-dependent oxidoreductase